MRPALLALLAVGLVGLGQACRAVEPTNRPIARCQAACEKRAKRQCTEAQCERGCEFILDRLIEHEGDNVIACIARTARNCSDVVWADCAAQVGPHADGGPPGPVPPSEDE